MLDSAYHIDRLLAFQVDQSHLSGKTHGGLCVYINKDWRINCSETLATLPASGVYSYVYHGSLHPSEC